MPKRIRLGTVTNGTLDSTDATIEIDGDDLYITVENGDVRTDGTVAFEDATADPSANGEIQRNGADLKAYSGGAVRNLTDIGGGFPVTNVSSSQNTDGSGIYLVDTSGGAVTLTLDTDDATGEAAIGVVNVTGTNGVTVDTEGSETIDPGGDSSKALSTAGWLVWFEGDGTNWDSSLAGDFESVTADDLGFGSGTLYQSGEYAAVMAGGAVEDLSNVTSTGSFTQVGNLGGGVNVGDMPAAASLYGEFFVRGSISDGAETLTVRPRIVGPTDFGTSVNELEVTIGTTSSTTASTGETEITAGLNDDVYNFQAVEAQVTGGTGSFAADNCGLFFYWRID